MSSFALKRRTSRPTYRKDVTFKTRRCFYRPPGRKNRNVEHQNKNEVVHGSVPPPLSKEENEKVVQYKKQKEELTFNVKDCEVTLETIKQQLHEIKTEIETIRLSLERIAAKISSCESRETLVELNGEQLRLHKRLMTLLTVEEKLIAKLESQRRALLEAKVKNHTFKIDVEDKIDSIYKIYEDRKKFEYKRRVEKDQTVKKNARGVHSKILKSWADCYQNRGFRPTQEIQDSSVKKKTLSKKFRHFYKLSLRKSMLDKINANGDKAMRQTHQYSGLVALRNQLNEQKNTLWVAAKIRQRRAKRREQLEEKVKQDLIASGENPYIASKIIEVLRKQPPDLTNTLKKDPEEELTRRLAQEYEQEANYELKRERQRAKWDIFWNNLARQKRRRLQIKNRQFLAVETDAGHADGDQLLLDKSKPDAFNFDLVLKEQDKSPYHAPELPELKIKGIHNEGESKPEETLGFPSEKSIEKVDDDTERKGSKSSGRRKSSKRADKTKKTETETMVGKARKKTGKKLSASSKVEIAENVEIPEEEQQDSKDEPVAIPVLREDRIAKREKMLPNGPSFKWTPEIITFKDFEVGKAYRKKVAVTSTSRQITKFYYKGIENIKIPVPHSSRKSLGPVDRKDSVKNVEAKEDVKPNPLKILTINDLLTVDFNIPPPLPPGIPHSFFVTFKPQAEGEWKGELWFETPIESFFIPIQCVGSKFVPILLPPRITFKNVVVDTCASAIVKLQNAGGKPGIISGIVKVQDTADSQSAAFEKLMQEPEIKEEPEVKEEPKIEVQETDLPKTKPTKSPRKSKTLKKQEPPPEPEPEPSSPPPESTVQQVVKENLDTSVTKLTNSTFIAFIEENRRTLMNGDYVHIKIQFHPILLGTFSATFEIQFEDSEAEPVHLQIEGTGIENPVFLEPLNTNMKICILDFNYQQVITIKNNSKTTGKVTAKVPLALRPFVQVHPKEYQVLATSSAQFSVKFHPRMELFIQDAIDEFYDRVSHMIDFPVYFSLNFPIEIPGPLQCTFQALLSDSTLEVNPTEIDFGTCLTSETVRGTVSITNRSFTVQHIGFVDVPQHIIIQPNNGFGKILPSETQEWDVLVSMVDTLEGKQKYTLKVQSLEKAERTIELKMLVKSNSVEFSHSRICFPATCVGSVSSTVIEIFAKGLPNKFRGLQPHLPDGRDYKFEFIVNDSYPIVIRPLLGHLQPGKSVKILVNFTAIITEGEVKDYYVDKLESQFYEVLSNLQKELKEINEALTAAGYADELTSIKGAKSKESLRSQRKTRSKSPDKGKSKNKSKSNSPSKEKEKKKRDGSKTKTKKSRKSGETETDTSEGLATIKDEDILPSSVLALKRQKANVTKLLESHGTEFVPPPLDEISMNSLEVVKAKRQLMQLLSTQSRTYRIPCQVTDLTTGVDDVLLLNIKCPMQKPDFVVENAANIIDFGTIALGSKTIQEIFLHNLSLGYLKLKMGIVNPFGSYVRVNALRKFGPDEVYTLRLKFAPRTLGYCEDVIVIRGGESRIILLLTGTSVKPRFSITPSNSIVYVGSIEIKTLARYTFEIKNGGNVPLEFKIEGGDTGDYNGPDITTLAPPPQPQNMVAKESFSKTRAVSAETKSKKTKTGKGSSKSPKKSSPSPKRKKSQEELPKPKMKTSETSLRKLASRESPEVNDFPFEIEEDNQMQVVGLNKLISFMDKKKQILYFGASPRNLVVPGGEQGSFEIGFVPNEPGKYFRTFNLKLFDKVVQTFTVVGIGTKSS